MSLSMHTRSSTVEDLPRPLWMRKGPRPAGWAGVVLIRASLRVDPLLRPIRTIRSSSAAEGALAMTFLSPNTSRAIARALWKYRGGTDARWYGSQLTYEHALRPRIPQLLVTPPRQAIRHAPRGIRLGEVGRESLFIGRPPHPEHLIIVDHRLPASDVGHPVRGTDLSQELQAVREGGTNRGLIG